MLTLKENAKRYFHDLLVTDPKQPLGIRFAVKKGGCSGLEYDWGVVLEGQEQDEAYEQVTEQAITFYIPRVDVAKLRGCVIDCEAGALDTHQLKVIHNPNASQGCGCGISFGVKTASDQEDREE